jgi:hypothetical protein
VSGLVRYTIYEVVPEEIVAEKAGIPVQFTYWPGPPTYKVLWKLIQQSIATKHIIQDIQHDIHFMWSCTILLKKCCVHMPCSWNDIILQLLQVLLACYGACHKDRSNKPLLADRTPQGTFCRMEWCLHDHVWIFRGLEPRVLLVHEPTEVKKGFILFSYFTKHYSTNYLNPSKICYHTSLYDPILSGRSVAPTS